MAASPAAAAYPRDRAGEPIGDPAEVQVVRPGLRRLRDVTERQSLWEAYRHASRATRASLSHDEKELDHLAAEGLYES